MPAEEELVDRHVVRVRPHAQVGIVGELVAGRREVVQRVRPRRIPGLRDREALVVRRRVDVREAELAQDPPVGHAVVHHDRVAVVVRRAQSAEGPEEAAQLEERGHRRSGLVVDPGEQVDHLDVVVGPHRAVGVRGREQETERGEVVGVASALEADDRRRHREVGLEALDERVDVSLIALLLRSLLVLGLPDRGTRFPGIGPRLGEGADGLGNREVRERHGLGPGGGSRRGQRR